MEVITGLIKANITSRIALQVASQIDSRTIIDMGGAEKLLGHGDMLYLAGDTGKPKRIQGPYISEQEVKKVVNHIADQYKNVDFEDMGPALEQSRGGHTKTQGAFEINFDEVADELDDELYEEARQIVIEAGKASTSYLQRKLKIGYARAARLVDMLEERGVVGQGEGAKARQVLIVNENGNALEAEADKLLGESKILTSLGIVILLLLSFGVYGLYKAKAFLEGPQIIIESPIDGQGVEESFTEIIGKTSNISTLFLNGKQIFTDKDGRFKDNLLLAEGYNIIEVSGADKFGRATKEKLELVFNKK